MIDTKAIKAAAEAATQGDWVVNRCDTSFAIVSPCKRKAVKYDRICSVVWWSDRAYGPQVHEAEANATHIATANPATVIALCDEVERLTTIASELQDLCDRQAKRLAEVEKELMFREDR